MDKPFLELTLEGPRGNAYVILGSAEQAAKEADWTQEQFDAYIIDATSGDYDHLVEMTKAYFDVTITGEDNGMF